MDTVFIKGLRLNTIIGCYDHEKLAPQPVIIDLDMAWDIERAAQSDDLVDTLDYDAVSKCVEKLLTERRFELVESLAELIAATIMADFRVQGVRVRLAKPDAILNTESVGVHISRGIPF